MPYVLVCSACKRSEVQIRRFELIFRGYGVGVPHNTRNMRRVTAGSVDLCESCLLKLAGDLTRDFKDIDQAVMRPPRPYQKSEFRGKSPKSRKTPENAEKRP